MRIRQSKPPRATKKSGDQGRTVEEEVALLNDLLVLGVLAVPAVGLDDAIHLVDRAIEPTGRDEPREVAMEKMRGRATNGRQAEGCKRGTLTARLTCP